MKTNAEEQFAKLPLDESPAGLVVPSSSSCDSRVLRGEGAELQIIWRGGRAMSNQDREARWGVPDAASLAGRVLCPRGKSQDA